MSWFVVGEGDCGKPADREMKVERMRKKKRKWSEEDGRCHSLPFILKDRSSRVSSENSSVESRNCPSPHGLGRKGKTKSVHVREINDEKGRRV